MGRPKKKPPAHVDTATLVERLAAAGARIEGIAVSLGTSPDTFRGWLLEDPAIRKAYHRGRESERHLLHSILRDKAERGNIVAAMFLLKSRHGYREGDPVEINTVHLSFTLPAAMSLEQFKALHATGTAAQQPAETPALIARRA